MTTDFDFSRSLELLRKAKLKLSGVKYRLFGLFLYPLKCLFFYNDSPIEGYVRYEKKENAQMYENKIFINAKFIDEYPDYKTKNLIDILLHELNHIIRRHDIRRGSRDPLLWNVACDHIIDKSLKALNISKPIVGWNIIKEIEYDQKYQSEESVYNWLFNEKKETYSPKITLTLISSNGDGNSNGLNSNGQDDNSQPKAYIKVKENFSGNTFNVSLDLESSSEENINNPNFELAPEQAQEIENFISQIRAVYNIEKERGTVSSNIQETFDKLLEVKIPWTSILEKAIKTNAFERVDRRNWRRLNKYYIGININLPGRIIERERTGVGTLIIHIDSSGSISPRDLQKAGYIISKSMQYFEKINLIVADVNIHQNVFFNKNQQTEFLSYFKDEGIKGRGGTSHKFVFEYFQKYFEEHVDELSMCITITDMYSDLEKITDSYDFWKKVPLIILSSSSVSFEKEKIQTINF